MMEKWGQVTKQPVLKAVSSGEELLALRTQVDAIHVAPAVQAYILALVRSSRDLAAQAEGTNGGAKRLLNFGASPRASLALFQAGRALAWLRGSDYLSPALVQEIFHDALRHRVGLTYEAEAEGLSTDKVLDQVLIRTPVPAKV
jgi:MoxR-like ATPase